MKFKTLFFIIFLLLFTINSTGQENNAPIKKNKYSIGLELTTGLSKFKSIFAFGTETRIIENYNTLSFGLIISKPINKKLIFFSSLKYRQLDSKAKFSSFFDPNINVLYTRQEINHILFTDNTVRWKINKFYTELGVGLGYLMFAHIQKNDEPFKYSRYSNLNPGSPTHFLLTLNASLGYTVYSSKKWDIALGLTSVTSLLPIVYNYTIHLQIQKK